MEMNRSELQDQLIQQMLDDMDLKTMTQLCYDYLDEGYGKYSDEELITECKEYYPELLEEWRSDNWNTVGWSAPRIVYCILMSKNETDLFYSALQSLPQFCYETDADWGMVYDFMEAQCGELTDAQWDEVEKVYNPYLNDSRYWV